MASDSLLQPAAAVRAITEFRRHIDPAVRAVSERHVVFDTPQIIRSDLCTGIFLEFPADGRVQLVNAAAAGSPSNIPGIPPESRYEKHMEIPVRLMDLVPGQFPARRAYYIVISPYIPVFVLYAKNSDKKHTLTLLGTHTRSFAVFTFM